MTPQNRAGLRTLDSCGEELRRVSRLRRARALMLISFLASLVFFGLQVLGRESEGGVGNRPRTKLGKLDIKVGLMPILSKKLPSFQISVGDYRFKPPDNLDLSELIPTLRPRFDDIHVDLGGNVLNSSNLMIPGRNIWVFTTAALPWRTGTAVNPTLRAGYLLRLTPAAKVTLMVPWVDQNDQKKVMGSVQYTKPKQQERDIRKWLRKDAGMADVADRLSIRFYKGRYHPDYGSIFPVEDLLALVPQGESDVAVLEEPEHLNWFHPETPEYWRSRFKHVVGIIHTNYLAYTTAYVGGYYKRYILYLLNRWMVPAHCDKVIKLSGVLQRYSGHKETVENVHGVREDFLKRGLQASTRPFKKNFYFIGKMLQAKGLPILFDLMNAQSQRTSRRKGIRASSFFSNTSASKMRIPKMDGAPDPGKFVKESLSRLPLDLISEASRKGVEGEINMLSDKLLKTLSSQFATEIEAAETRGSTSTSLYRGMLFRKDSRFSAEEAEHLKNLKIDIYGSGPDEEMLHTMAQSKKLGNITFHPAIDHLKLSDYKTMINPSISEVLCTTTAEALAMGKFVICPSHESNNFFKQFPNCLMYSTPKEFYERIQYAEKHDPQPLSNEHYRALTWEAATERFITAAQITEKMAQIGWQDDVGAKFHTWLGKGKKGNVIRRFAGAAPLLDSPPPKASDK
mmetsp:Transcript_2774/g.6439  ORF Transcript_2774/g.6439 Transcript_2774/m.6439 type:complete len:682 (+) Transcript_2774:127-2172(+)|eukprot:CAMPEP_0114516380 /NCGR_PEP_ID=MMETSP0109-20121206/17294_1 /TAXON_ID=29199 /ORGANISM="Chlorarachnion reptans, Strain CCCM449" /LENGTH=681 /DNA_ID=CAMNT_0001696759 /DNA_START=71 /DNA_END=2116 /DNA_ORIENTATION=-